MKLNDSPFQSVKRGVKTIEIRLNDEKRQQIQHGDKIVFTNLSTSETERVKVIAIKKYDTFQALLKDFTNVEVGFSEEMQLSQKLAQIYQIYTQTSELEYGALAIKIERSI